MGTEEIDKHVFRKYEIHTKLGKGVSSSTPFVNSMRRCQLLQTLARGPLCRRMSLTGRRQPPFVVLGAPSWGGCETASIARRHAASKFYP
jgi:hypothetical protein